MQLHKLQPKTKARKGKRVGRGGKRGTYSGKGLKGQKSRAGHRIRPELRDIMKKLPKMRGRGKNSNLSIEQKPFVINLDTIEKSFTPGTGLTPTLLVEKNLISLREVKRPIKILGRGVFSKKMTFTGFMYSKSARVKIAAVGGEIISA
jgi:large subunit ribosomal protein L15